MQESLSKDYESVEELELTNTISAKILYGELNSNLKEIEKKLGVKIHSRGSKLTILGERLQTESAKYFINQIYSLINKGYLLQPGDIEIAKRILDEKKSSLEEIFLDTVCISVRKKIIAPKTINQKLYIDTIRNNDVVFGIGPAGTGKT
ncbi:MAG: PhoH family protein, partial [Thermodesulfobacteriota bacterium]